MAGSEVREDLAQASLPSQRRADGYVENDGGGDGGEDEDVMSEEPDLPVARVDEALYTRGKISSECSRNARGGR